MRDGPLRQAGGKLGGRPAPSLFGAVVCGDCGLLAEADHRIANHLAMLAGYVRLKSTDLFRQPTPPSQADVHLLLEAVGVQIDAVARLHRALAVDGRPASTDVAALLHEVCAPFAAGAFGPVELIEDCAPGCVVRLDQSLPLAQIVAEVVTNAVKHQAAGGAIIAIMVRCRRDKAGGLMIEVTDDGPGLPATFDAETEGGFGFRLLRGLGRQLGATITFQSASRGLRFRLTLPPSPGEWAESTIGAGA